MDQGRALDGGSSSYEGGMGTARARGGDKDCVGSVGDAFGILNALRGRANARRDWAPRSSIHGEPSYVVGDDCGRVIVVMDRGIECLESQRGAESCKVSIPS